MTNQKKMEEEKKERFPMSRVETTANKLTEKGLSQWEALRVSAKCGADLKEANKAIGKKKAISIIYESTEEEKVGNKQDSPPLNSSTSFHYISSNSPNSSPTLSKSSHLSSLSSFSSPKRLMQSFKSLLLLGNSPSEVTYSLIHQHDLSNVPPATSNQMAENNLPKLGEKDVSKLSVRPLELKEGRGTTGKGANFVGSYFEENGEKVLEGICKQSWEKRRKKKAKEEEKEEEKVEEFKFVGNFENGKESGFGVLWHRKEGENYFYLGEWVGGDKSGRGCSFLEGQSCFSFVGNFLCGRYSGRGVFKKEGSKFVGEWSSSQLEGVGLVRTMEKTKESETVSQWSKNKGEGLAVLSQKDGAKFFGILKNGIRNIGMDVSKTRIFLGNFHGDLIVFTEDSRRPNLPNSSFGAKFSKDGSSYKGGMCGGVYEGVGVYTFPRTNTPNTCPTRVVGVWKKGKPVAGKMEYGGEQKGDYFTGTFTSKWKRKEGTYFSSSTGCKTTAKWNSNNSPSSGKSEYSKNFVGDVYIGNYRNWKAHGFGKYIFSQGGVFEGTWREGKRHGRGVFVGGESFFPFFSGF